MKSKADDHNRVVMYTDGGADPNPGPGGWGVVLLHPHTGKRKELSGGEDGTTNNRMEMTAAIRGLEQIKETATIDLYTDSKYLRDGITRWIDTWKHRGWKLKDGGQVKNVDLWRQLAALVEEQQVSWHWVKGHAGTKENERADALATAEIRRRKRSHRPPPPSSTKTTAGLESATEPRISASTVSRHPAGPEAVVFLKVSCVRGQGGWAARVRHGDRDSTLKGRELDTTANRLIILAASQALEELPERISVTVHTASDYLREGASSWLRGWQQRGWRTAARKAVKNADLWRRLETALRGREVSWPVPSSEADSELEALEPIAKQALREG